MERIRRYSELIKLQTFEERFEYLRLDGVVGAETFGFDRYLNQIFYKSSEWRALRNVIITRDEGCDLGIPGHEIFGPVLIHHMNPISPEDIVNRSDILLNPEYLITTMHSTHQAITYGDSKMLPQKFVERQPNDTCPWRQKRNNN